MFSCFFPFELLSVLVRSTEKGSVLPWLLLQMREMIGHKCFVEVLRFQSLLAFRFLLCGGKHSEGGICRGIFVNIINSGGAEVSHGQVTIETLILQFLVEIWHCGSVVNGESEERLLSVFAPKLVGLLLPKYYLSADHGNNELSSPHYPVETYVSLSVFGSMNVLVTMNHVSAAAGIIASLLTGSKFFLRLRYRLARMSSYLGGAYRFCLGA